MSLQIDPNAPFSNPPILVSYTDYNIEDIMNIFSRTGYTIYEQQEYYQIFPIDKNAPIIC